MNRKQPSTGLSSVTSASRRVTGAGGKPKVDARKSAAGDVALTIGTLAVARLFQAPTGRRNSRVRLLSPIGNRNPNASLATINAVNRSFASDTHALARSRLMDGFFMTACPVTNYSATTAITCVGLCLKANITTLPLQSEPEKPI